MFKPNYKITDKLIFNIKRITLLIAELNNRRYPRVVLLTFEKRAMEISAHSSTSIEGNPLPLTEVKKILKNNPKNLRDSEKEVINYNKALTKLNELVKKNKIKFDLNLILQIQKIITRGLINEYGNGKVRRAPVFVNDPRLRRTVYWPPDHKDVLKLLRELFDFVNKNRGSMDPLFLAGIFHKQFVIIHPFLDGNGRTVRLVTKVLLADMGLDTFSLFSFENYYNQNVAKYFENVGVLGSYYDIKDKIDFTVWLEFFTDGIIDELLRVQKELSREVMSPQDELKDYHRKILERIKNNGYITDREYSKLTDRARPTRNLDFKKLFDLKIIKRYGKGRATYYKLS